MRVDLDALLGERRRQSVKYRYLSWVFDPRICPPQYAREISVLVATPGISVDNVRALMRWHPGFYAKCVKPLISTGPDIVKAGQDNAASVTEQDGLDLLIAVHLGRGVGPMPVYAAMWLQEQWRGGRTQVELARQLGVSVQAVSAWKAAI